MEGCVKRLIVEKNDLEKKISKLLVFIKSDKFKSLPEEDQFLLNIQRNCMLSYFEILEQRFKRFDF